jgi:methionine-rich copper-binding protein CopC
MTWPLAIAALVMLTYPQAMPPTLPVVCTLSAVACENQLAGNPETEWEVTGTGSDKILGFTTDISVNVGSTVHFKIDEPSPASLSPYTIDIYRMGYYQGNGARKVAPVTPSPPSHQPVCYSDANVGITDCGNWTESASWAVPASAVSGVYFARLRRNDNGEASHIMFVVRNDGSHADAVYQTSDPTWQAYNLYGGSDFYQGVPAGRAYKLSYNRPFTTRADGPYGEDWIFANEYPMIRWIERNGYDVTYQSGVDTDRLGSLLTNHKMFLSVGHDEYWSGNQRANVEAARDAGVSLAFFSGNEVYWKTRYEVSQDGSSTPYRTIVTYKETRANAKSDPNPAWTGTWRDPRFSPPADGGRPENALTGTMYTSNCCNAPIQVPEPDGKMRLWRNTTVATQAVGATASLADGTMGYEFDEPLDNGFSPAGLIYLSTTTQTTDQYLLDWGINVGTGTATHHLTLYRAPSGALVFGAGTIQWAWGLDDNHDGPINPAPDSRMQQATANLFADMGVQPTTLQAGLVAPLKTTDSTAPTSAITAPAAGATVTGGTNVTISGTAADTGGQVGGIEVSTDGGTTWHPASGRGSWTYTWNVQGFGPTDIKVRATDDSANRQTAVTTRTVNVNCPCTVFGAKAPTIKAEANDSQQVQVGLKFRSDYPGNVTGVRFYKGTGNGGTHKGSLWSADGTRLATGTFTGETASGWQTLTFASPVAIQANTTYIASYLAPQGRYAVDLNTFNGKGVDRFPLHALQDGLDGGNGVYTYGNDLFPTNSNGAADYGVDVTFQAPYGPDIWPPVATPTNPGAGATIAPVTSQVKAVFNETVQPATIAASLSGPGGAVAGSTTYDPATKTVTVAPAAALAYNTTYTATVSGAKDTAGNTMSPVTWTFTTALAPRPAGVCPCYVFHDTDVPVAVDGGDTGAVEVGMRFRADYSGQVTGIRFYKSSANTGTHVGNLWTNTGTKLATVTFAGESSTGWQQANLSTPVTLTAGTTYVVSYYAPHGHYSANGGQFGAAVDNAPLHGLANGTDGSNGVYTYGAASVFPTSSWGNANYWVDVVYSVPPDTTPPAIATSSPGPGMPAAPVTSTVSATFDEPVQGGTATIALSGPGGAVAGSSAFDAPSRTITFLPSASLAYNTTYTVTVAGAKDTTGNTMSPKTWTFTTALAPRAPGVCPCTVFSESATPAIAASTDTSAVEVGMRFRSDVNGTITGVRFYKGAGNTGTHVGNLWSNTGTKLATVTFGGETTAGWQQANFSAPVSVTAGTTYVVSYYAPNGHYAVDSGQFGNPVDRAPLHGLANGTDGSNGVYLYSATSAFPTSTYFSANYWVDAVFSLPADTTPPTVASASPPQGSTIAPITTTIQATFSEDVQPATITAGVTGPGGAVTGAGSYDVPSRTYTFTPTASLAYNTAYTVTLAGVKDTAGNTMMTTSWTFTTAATPPAPGACPCSIFAGTATPATAAVTDSGSVEVGVRFRSDIAGQIAGIRFYKGAGNTGTHVGHLWSNTGTLLATVTFTGELASGWQQATFSAPVTIIPGQTYVASYFAPSGHYSVTSGQFAAAVDNGPLHGLANGTDGANGVYLYAPSGGFPTGTWGSTNYWVDVVFQDVTPPTVTTTAPGTGSSSNPVATTKVKAAFSEAVQPATIVIGLSGPGGAVAGTTAYDAATKTVTFTPGASLAASATYTATVSGAKDLSGNTMATKTWTFTTAGSCPCSVFASDFGPAITSENDSGPLNLGLRFRPDVNGSVTAIRFYKGAGNTGTHVGTLWSSTGTALATVTFTNETASGWQVATLSTPVAVTAGTQYVVSYFAPSGHYAADPGLLASAYDNAPLHGLSGLYAYAGASTFPASTSSASYGVDIVFSPGP